MPETGVLETLVKLASLGTSGICIFVIFWAGWLLFKSSDHENEEVQKTLRFYLVVCVVVAVISAAAAFWGSPSLHKKIRMLEGQSQPYTVTGTVKKNDNADSRDITIITEFPPLVPDSGGKLVDLVVRKDEHGKFPKLSFTCAGYDLKGLDLNNPSDARLLDGHFIDISEIMLNRIPQD